MPCAGSAGENNIVQQGNHFLVLMNIYTLKTNKNKENIKSS